MVYTRISVDTSKSTFTVHGVDDRGQTILRRNLSRSGFERFMREISATEVVLEACGSSHHWGRFLGGLGHTVIAAQLSRHQQWPTK